MAVPNNVPGLPNGDPMQGVLPQVWIDWAGVGNQLAGVGNQLAGVGNQLAGVGAGVNHLAPVGVGNQLAGLGNQIAGVGNQLAGVAVGNQLAGVANQLLVAGGGNQFDWGDDHFNPLNNGADNDNEQMINGVITPHESKKKKYEKTLLFKRKLGKRLAYILRYGAVREGLDVKDGGYVSLPQMMQVPLLHKDKLEDIMLTISKSRNRRGEPRFEMKKDKGVVYVRAVERKMETNPCHEGTKVLRLMDQCLGVICKNIQLYDLSHFPDDYLLGHMIHKLKRDGKLTTRAMQTLLCPALSRLDLESVYVTTATMKAIMKQCPNLKELSLKSCGYIVTDHLLQQLFKNVNQLEKLNLTACFHITDLTLHAISKNLNQLKELNLSMVNNITEDGILKLVQKCEKLIWLDIFEFRKFSYKGRVNLTKIASSRGMTVLLNEKNGLTGNGAEEMDPMV